MCVAFSYTFFLLRPLAKDKLALRCSAPKSVSEHRALPLYFWLRANFIGRTITAKVFV